MAVSLAATPLHSAAAQARPVSRAAMSPAMRAALDRGAVVKVAGAGTRVPLAAVPVPPPADTGKTTAPTVTLNRGEVLVARTGTKPTFLTMMSSAAAHGGRRPASDGLDSVFALPLHVLAADARGRASEFVPVYLPEGQLQFVADSNDFEGVFLVGIQRLDTTDATGLEDSVAVAFGGDPDLISPRSLTFHDVGEMLPVRVVAKNPHDSLMVEIMPGSNPPGTSVWIRVAPALAFETPPTSIEGYGIETATLVIGTRGTNAKDSIELMIGSDRGNLSARTLTVGPSGGIVTLQSAGALGPVTVRARSNQYGTAEATIRFVPPVRFALAALLGAILGSVYAQTRAKRTSSDGATTATASRAKMIAAGALGAVLATAIYVALGIALVPGVGKVPLVNEAAVFAFAAFGGMAGLKVPTT
jgi:hypothetical protein